jgi:hypothetical protein
VAPLTRRRSDFRSGVALLAACSLLLSTAPPIGAQAQLSATPPGPDSGVAAKPAAAETAATAAGPDGGWPRRYSTPSGGHLVIYQPQVASWTGQTHMVAYSAVAFTPRDAAKAEMGTIRI